MERRSLCRSFSSVVPEPNTFIGAGSGYTTAADIASVTSLSESDIVNFQIDANSNITFYTDTFYTVSGDIKNASYYIDLDGYITSITTVFNGANINKRTLIFPSLSSCPVNCFRGGGLGTKSFWGILSFPLLNPIGTTVSNNNCFDYFEADKVYVNGANETNNGGSPDGDISSAVGSNIGTVLNYSANTTTPSEVDDLAVSVTLGSVVTLTLTPPTSTNTIEYYIVFVNGALHSYHSTTTITVGNLDLSTFYEFRVIAIDEMGNISGFSNTASTTTLSTYQIPTGNIISYWNFDSNSNDQVGSNNGTDTDISYVSGLISNSASFNGSSSKITILDDDTLSFPNIPFTFSIWVYMDAFGTPRFFFGKRNTTLAEYQLGYVSGELRFRLFGGTIANILLFNKAYTFSLSTWHHVAVTYDNTDLSLYVDGVNVPVSQTTVGTFTGSSNTTAPLIIGQDSEGSPDWFDGLQDEFSIFDIALSNEQLMEIYNKNLAGLYLTE